MEEIIINSEYITLVQLLKIVGIVQSGGEGKIFLLETKIKVNNKNENRRGKKLYKDYIIEILGYGKYKIVRLEE